MQSMGTPNPQFEELARHIEREREHDREKAVLAVEARDQPTGTPGRFSLVRRLLRRIRRDQAR
jgi:hypothetical protein